MQVNAQNNVGINTTNPQASLDVRGNVRIGTNGNFMEFDSTSGNLGIGTSSPLGKLHASRGPSGVIPFGSAIVGESNGAAYMSLLTPNSEAGIIFGNNSGNTSGGIYYNNANNINGFQIRTNGNVARMAIDDAGRVGIGTIAPFAPLTFPSTLGEKIALYGNATNSYGFGIQNGTLQIHSDAVGADIAFGYMFSGNFVERLRIKGTGAIVLGGSQGSLGQVIQSNGAGLTATWASSTNTLYNNTVSVLDGSYQQISTGTVPLNGMSYSFSTAGMTKVMVSYSVPATNLSCAFCGASKSFIKISIDGTVAATVWNDVQNGSLITLTTTRVFTVAPGNHTVSLSAEVNGSTIEFGYSGDFPKAMTIQIIPQ